MVDLRSKSVDFLWCKAFVRPGGWGRDSPEAAVTALDLVLAEGRATGPAARCRRCDLLGRPANGQAVSADPHRGWTRPPGCCCRTGSRPASRKTCPLAVEAALANLLKGGARSVHQQDHRRAAVRRRLDAARQPGLQQLDRRWAQPEIQDRPQDPAGRRPGPREPRGSATIPPSRSRRTSAPTRMPQGAPAPPTWKAGLRWSTRPTTPPLVPTQERCTGSASPPPPARRRPLSRSPGTPRFSDRRGHSRTAGDRTDCDRDPSSAHNVYRSPGNGPYRGDACHKYLRRRERPLTVTTARGTGGRADLLRCRRHQSSDR